MDEMLKDLPWNSLEDIWHAIQSKSADISMMRGTTYKIASIKHPLIILFGAFFPYLISTIIFVTLCILLHFPLAILLSIPNIVYALFASHLNKIHSSFLWGVIILGFFILLPIWLYLWAFSIYLCKMIDTYFYSKAWKYTYEELRYNPDLFTSLYFDGLIGLHDCFGNFYRYNPILKQNGNNSTPSSIPNEIYTLLSDKDKIKNIINGIEEVDENLFLGFTNPYNKKRIENLDDIKEYLSSFLEETSNIDN